MRLFWHRRDLRAADNRGLHAAATAITDDGDDGDDGILPLFVLDDAVLAHAGPPRVRFLLDALADLRDWYRERDSDLLVLRGDPRAEVPALATDFDADRVVWNHDYSGLARERDDAVRAALDDAGVSHRQHHDAVHHEPGSITTNAGEHYSVFSYFGRKWADREKADPVPAPDAADLVDVAALDDPAVAALGDTGVEADPLPPMADLGVDPPAATVPDAGSDAARARLESFCEEAIFRYDEDRDVPAREGTSRLSPDLKFGTIGVREVYAATESAMARAADEAAAASVEEFRRQLAWREFYVQRLAADPSMVAENLQSFERPIDWRDDPGEIRAWKLGETGYPIVDAGMRQLREVAWMHNRVRMIVASFLTKDLLADWRVGYAHFREHLVDHDPAADGGGWQWAASTGADAQPYFRVFNPMTQGERYDPDAGYIHEHVPELRDVDAGDVHRWHEFDGEQREALAPDYPAPIVDHAERREAAIAMFERARGEEEG